MGVLDRGRRAAQRAGEGARRRSPRPAYSQARRSRSCARARRATAAPSPAFFWISASVCSTESCRWAATSARSWVRTRSARSAVRSRGQPVDPRPDHDREPATAEQRRDHDVARHRRPSRRAARTARARARAAPTPAREPGVRRPAAVAEHHPDRVDPAGGSSQRSRCASSAWRHSRATPATAEQRRPEDRAPADDRLDEQHRAEAERRQRDAPGPRRRAGGSARARRPPRVALSRPGASGTKRRVGGQHQPEAGVEERCRGRRAAPRPRTPARTHSADTPRCRASPAATPPIIGCCASRVARRTPAGRVAGAVLVMVPPSSQSATGPHHEARPRLDP